MELGQAKSWPHLYFASGCYWAMTPSKTKA
jgi:hypothetical protein